MENSTVVAVVANYKYLKKYFYNFITQLRINGKYSGDVLVITSFYTPTFLIRSLNKDKKVKVKRFKNIKFNSKTKKYLKELNTGIQPNRFKTKKFQWNKLNLFDPYLKKWKFVFYLDINMKIHKNINKLLEIKPHNVLFARSDSYPDYITKLSSQFDQTNLLFEKLESSYNLNTTNYFQTGILYFDTSIINEKTKKDILNLVAEFPISTTNEQGILNLFFKYETNVYTELPLIVDEKTTYFYWLLPNEEIIITKQDRIKYK